MIPIYHLRPLRDYARDVDALPSPLDIGAHETLDGCVEQPMSPEQALDVLSRFPGGPPDDADCLDWTNYASALYVTGRDEEALISAEHAVTLRRNSTTLLNLGTVLEGHGRFVDALVAFAEAHRRDPSSILAGAAYSDGLVRLGRWREGWPLYAAYHARLSPNEFRLPKFSDIAGRRIIVLANGGAGDNIYHLRWLRHFRDAGCHITFAGPEAFLSLLAGHPWIDRLLATPRRTFEIEWHTDGAPSNFDGERCSLNLNEFDFYLSSLSLPAVVGATLEPAIWPGPYVFAPPKRRWRIPLVFQRRSPRRIGVCWQAGEGRFPRPHRTLTLAQQQRLLRSRPMREWVNLTFDAPHIYGIHYPHINDWADTARIISGLDFVVTVDTGVAHLAAAMGREVLVILPAASAWPYHLGEDYHMPYPTMRVFRNDGLGIEDALCSACAALEEL